MGNMQSTKFIIAGVIVLAAVAGAIAWRSNTTGDDTMASTAKSSELENTNTNNKMESVATITNTVTMKTSLGEMTIGLYGKDAPKTVENFMKLSGERFYDGVKFHRVIQGFMNQTGDPQSKDDSKMNEWGRGGPGYRFNDEINPSSPIYKKGYKLGVVAMANAGPNTNGSQFFIMAADYPLPPSYTIFGVVTEGEDVIGKINNVKTNGADRPLSPVVIESITVGE
jgi:cyclophilin family peptidyl-prolyl cis-trans isomerase